MAAMSAGERAALTADVQVKWSADREAVPVPSKVSLRAVIDAIDTWISDNAASMNSAIPQPARSNLSAAQKAFLFAWVALRRYGSGT